MQTKIITHGGQYETGFTSTKPMLTKPTIVGTKEVKGETFYIDKQGKLYRPILFDAMFEVVKTPMKPNSHKGTNPNKKALK